MRWLFVVLLLGGACCAAVPPIAETNAALVNRDRDRVPIDTIIIHHTGMAPGVSLASLAKDQYRVYRPFEFALREARQEANQQLLAARKSGRGIKEAQARLKGIPKKVPSYHYQWKNETVNGKVVRKPFHVYYCYHWLVRQNGRVQRLLPDKAVAWNAGSWEWNNRSIAICLDGNFSSGKPPKAMVESVARLIAEYKQKYQIKYLLGHREVRATECPGKWLLSGGREELSQLSTVYLITKKAATAHR